MSIENFTTILSKVPLHVQIDFSGMSEPWANPQATPMLELALSLGYHIVVYTTLYGMTVQDAHHITNLLLKHRAQVKEVVIHLPDANGNMRGYKPSPEYSEVLGIFNAIGGKLRHFHAMTMDGRSRVHPSINVRAKSPSWSGLDRAGSLDVAAVVGQPLDAPVRHDSPLSCSFTPFYDHNVVLPNGDVVLCCMDYSLKHKVGNLLTGDYYSIFSSPGMGELRAENAKLGYGEGTICRKCRRATTYRLPDDNKMFWKQV